MANPKTPEEKAAAAAKKAAAAAAAAAAAEEDGEGEGNAPAKKEKKVKVILRSRIVWEGRRRKEFDEIEVTEEQKAHLEKDGFLASASDIAKMKKGEVIDNL